MKYNTYVEYCNLIEKLRSEAKDALYNACGAEARENEEETTLHRIIRMILEEAADHISMVLAYEEEYNPNIDPSEYLFQGRKLPEADYHDSFFEALDKEAAL